MPNSLLCLCICRYLLPPGPHGLQHGARMKKSACAILVLLVAAQLAELPAARAQEPTAAPTSSSSGSGAPTSEQPTAAPTAASPTAAPSAASPTAALSSGPTAVLATLAPTPADVRAQAAAATAAPSPTATVSASVTATGKNSSQTANVDVNIKNADGSAPSFTVLLDCGFCSVARCIYRQLGVYGVACAL